MIFCSHILQQAKAFWRLTVWRLSHCKLDWLSAYGCRRPNLAQSQRPMAGDGVMPAGGIDGAGFTDGTSGAGWHGLELVVSRWCPFSKPSPNRARYSARTSSLNRLGSLFSFCCSGCGRQLLYHLHWHWLWYRHWLRHRSPSANSTLSTAPVFAVWLSFALFWMPRLLSLSFLHSKRTVQIFQAIMGFLFYLTH